MARSPTMPVRTSSVPTPSVHRAAVDGFVVGRPVRRPPAVPGWFSRLGLALAVFALTTGFLDMVLGRLLDRPLFLASAVYQAAGAAGLFLYILVHNVGVAWMVFAVGSIAFAYEPEPRFRRWIRRILLASLLVSLLAVPLVYGIPEVEIAPALFLVEAEAVLILGIAGYWALHKADRDGVGLGWRRPPTLEARDRRLRQDGPAADAPSGDTGGIAHALALAAYTSFALLAFTAFIEVLVIAGVLG